jgi:hypothetical protein
VQNRKQKEIKKNKNDMNQKKLTKQEMCLVSNELEFDLIELDYMPFVMVWSIDQYENECTGILLSLN